MHAHHGGGHQSVPVSIPVPPELPSVPPPPPSTGHTANMMLHQIPPPAVNSGGQQGIQGISASELTALQHATQVRGGSVF